jgi:hypothetical protein
VAGKALGKGAFGKPKMRQQNNIKMDLWKK